MVRFRWSQPNDSLFVMDNSAKDLDAASGIVRIAAPKAAGYDACVRGTTTHFVADSLGASYPTCNSKFWLSYNFDLGYVYMRRKPMLTMRLTDMWSHLLPGGSARVYNQKGWTVDVADGSLLDDPSVDDGKITVALPTPGYYTYGEIKAPKGQWEMLGSAWYGVNAAWEGKYDTLIPHQQYTY